MVQDSETPNYFVVQNDELQYSIWPTYRTVPEGWNVIGKEKTKDGCLAYIESVWIDMRPLSAR